MEKKKGERGEGRRGNRAAGWRKGEKGKWA